MSPYARSSYSHTTNTLNIANCLVHIWVNEGFFQKAKYIGEKSYVLYNNDKTISHMKGLNRYFQERFVTDNIDTNLFPHIAYNIFQKN